MSTPIVVLVAPPAVACANPAFMCYGGVERVAWRLTRMLTSLGAEVVPVASADSTFGADVSGRGLFEEEAWARPNRVPPAYAEDVPTMLARFGAHVESVVARERPDTVILLGPSLAVLNGAIRAVKTIDAQLLVTLHNGPGDNAATIPILAATSDITLFALSEKQRVAFGKLATRIEVVTDGIPVAAVPFSVDPAAIRAKLAIMPAYRSLNLRADRPLVGQIDYFHSNKAMLTTLQMFRNSGIWRTHDLILAGGPGWQLQGRVPLSGPSYLARMREFVAEHQLEDCVRVLGPLPGRQVAELNGAMDLAISPVRLEDPRVRRDPESYGQGRAMANAAGTPVLMSDAYDPSFAADPTLIFGDVAAGTERLRDFVASAAIRRKVRQFAEQRDTMLPGLARYASFVGLQRDQASLKAAIMALVADETESDRASELHLHICTLSR
jgi:glycosyltransferase involved in cell wall biosynthesis